MFFDKLKKNQVETQMTEKVDTTELPPIELELVGQELPFNWPFSRKVKSYIIALLINFVSAFNATGNSAARAGVTEEFGVSSSVFLTSSFTYNAALGLGPLFLAPLSEQYGRRPMLVSLLLLIVILFLPQALAPNISSLSISRLFQGTAASIEGPHVAGIISDLFHRDGGRGIAMATFTLVVFTANAIGPLTCNWLASETDWANIYWMQMAMNGVVFIMCAFMLDETRHDLILDKKITKYNKTYGTDLKVQTDAAHSVKKALTTSLARPLIYLTTEPIVIALSIWVGFAWGIVFLSTGTVLHVFEKTYDFTQGQGGTVLICGFIGAFFAWLVGFGQNVLYKKSKDPVTHIAPPEARLYQAALGAVLFGAFELMFAWTARPHIHWIVPCIALVGVNFGIFPIYAGVYTYIGDAYEKYSSSAQAAQANILGSTFPFFGTAMFDHLTFPWASSTIGFIAFGLSIIPFVLILFGGWLRDRSKVCRHILKEQEEEKLRKEEQEFSKPGDKNHV
ncbi:MFS general substrate transporter [Wallemia mellicola]|nr:MFS general substrate transporter [Wallemia mellicola]